MEVSPESDECMAFAKKNGERQTGQLSVRQPVRKFYRLGPDSPEAPCLRCTPARQGDKRWLPIGR
jgi:hypothetical protein